MSLLSDTDQAIPETSLENCRSSLLWSVWAQTNASAVLRLSQAGLTAKVVADEAAARELAQLYKMLMLDSFAVQLREGITTAALVRARRALAARGDIDIDGLLREDIDFTCVAPVADIAADDINLMRPNFVELFDAVR